MLFDGVWKWGCFDPEKKYKVNGFLFAYGGKTLVGDPPPKSDDDSAYFAALELKPDLLVITNRNHLRDRQSWLPAPTAMHDQERSQVDVAVARALKDGETLEPGLEVVHLPGKSPGEIGLYWRARKILMLGDALIAPQGRLKLIAAAKLDDPALLRRSLANSQRWISTSCCLPTEIRS